MKSSQYTIPTFTVVMLFISGMAVAQTLADRGDFVINPGRNGPDTAQPSRLPTTRLPDGVPIPGQIAPQNGDQTRPATKVALPSESLQPALSPTSVGQTLGSNSSSGAGIQCQILQNPNGRSSAILFDPNLQVIAVYNIDSVDGSITLMSVRKITWDLQMEEYNSGEPAPEDIRSMQPR